MAVCSSAYVRSSPQRRGTAPQDVSRLVCLIASRRWLLVRTGAKWLSSQASGSASVSMRFRIAQASRYSPGAAIIRDGYLSAKISKGLAALYHLR
jgi:hypothetical protein